MQKQKQQLKSFIDIQLSHPQLCYSVLKFLFIVLSADMNKL